MNKIESNIYFNKNELVKLNRRGQIKHKTYPVDKALKIIDIYKLPNANLERYTCSCDEEPNPKSKKGVYYVLNTEVENYNMEENSQMNLASFKILNATTDIEKLSIDNITFIVNKCLNTLESDIANDLTEILQVTHKHLENFLEIKETTKLSFENNIKYSLLYVLDRKIIAKLGKQATLIKYNDFYIQDIAHKIISYLHSNLDALDINDLAEHFREDNYKISLNDLTKALTFLIDNNYIEAYFYVEDRRERYRLVKTFKDYLERRRF